MSFMSIKKTQRSSFMETIMRQQKEKDDRATEKNKNFKSCQTLIGCRISTSSPGYAPIGQLNQSRVMTGNPRHYHQ